MTSTARTHSPTLINFRSLGNPHGLRFAEGDGGAPAGQAGGDEGQQPISDQPAPKPAPPTTAPQQQPTDPTAGDGKVEDLPDWAQKIIRDARDGEAKARTNAKQQAANDAKAELAQTIGKALGLVKEDEPVDPDKLAADLQNAQGAQRDTALELAIYKAAATAGADPTKLTDSRSFMASIPTDLDPTNTDAVTAIVKAAVDSNPTLKTVRVTGASSADHAGGSGDTTKRTPGSLTEAVGSFYGA